MFCAESWKLLIKQKGLILLSIFLLLKIVCTLTAGYDSEHIIDRNPEGYAKYINLYKGKATKEKGKAIEEEAFKISRVRGEIDTLLTQKKEGKISKEEYEQNVIKYYERDRNASVFGIVYNQYFYAKEAPEERYIMDERGWSTLLSHGNPDFFLILCLILLLVPTFCNEYESGMDTLLLSTRRGKYQTGMVKLLSGIIIAIGITALFSLTEIVLMEHMIGLSGGSYPLQSLQFFHNSIYHISIIEAYILVVLCRMLGTILLVAYISICSVVFKRSIITLFICSILIFFPYALLKGHSVLYYLPVPSGLFTGEEYLRGTSYITQMKPDGTKVNVIQFMQIGIRSFIILMVGYVLLASILMLLTLKRYSKIVFRCDKFMKSIKFVSIYLSIALLCTLFSGCTQKENSEEPYTVCASESLYHGRTLGYNIRFDINQQSIIAENEKTAEKINLLREPLSRDTYIYGIFVWNGWCYYLEKEISKKGFRIYGIDLTNFKQGLIYNSVPEQSEYFFGIISTNNDIEGLLEVMNGYKGFFLDNEYIYCFDMQDSFVQIDRHTGREKLIAIDARYGATAYFHNGDVYYSDSQNRLCVFMKKDGKVHVIDSLYTVDFNIRGNRIEYKNILNNNKVEYYDIE